MLGHIRLRRGRVIHGCQWTYDCAGEFHAWRYARDLDGEPIGWLRTCREHAVEYTLAA